MRIDGKTFGVVVAAAFITGFLLSPLAQRAIAPAAAAAPGLTPMVIDLTALEPADLGSTPYPELRSKTLVTTDNATIAIQAGNVAKHMHPQTDEIQYIVAGSGSIWLGAERKDFKPGTLLIIPKGTAHAGSIVSKGPVKAIAIKIPPQPAGDITFVD
jgi:mannose-6-phosphate isomerase-like protein (cupin superfamily)